MSTTCASCGHPVEDRYCSRCGEERLDPGKLTVWHFVTRTLPSEVLDLDGKIWRTLRLLLFRPAFLSVEYAAGRRRPYVKPLRVLLTAIVIYALSTPGGRSFTLRWPGTELVLSMAPAALPPDRSIESTLFQIDRFGILRGMYEEKLGPVDQATEDVRKRFSGMLNAVATPLSFTSVVLLACALYVCFHRRRPLYVEHAVFSMYNFSFVLLSTLILVFGFPFVPKTVLFVVPFLFSVWLWQFAYLAVAMRRFYFPHTTRVVAWPTAGALAVLFVLLNSFFITAVQFLAGAFAIWRL